MTQENQNTLNKAPSKKVEIQKFTLYDTYQKKLVTIDPEQSVEKGVLKMYSCGPTVYGYQHIGNLRAVFLPDMIARIAKISGWKVEWISNITDVGHLVGDGDNGQNVTEAEDKLEKGAKRENKSVQEIVDFYTIDFVKQCEVVGIDLPSGKMLPKATEYIKEQMILALTLMCEGKAYVLADGIYFDSNYNSELFGESDFVITQPLKAILEIQAKIAKGNSNQFTGRDIKNITKNPEDFALWKFVSEDSLQKWRFRDFEEVTKVLHNLTDTNSKFCDYLDQLADTAKYESYLDFIIDLCGYPGCPGWHSECVAMICAITSTITPSKSSDFVTPQEGNLGFSFNPFKDRTVIDLHLGGEDHIDVHHKNEILQSEALGFHLSKYWVHNKFVTVDGKKMSKSLGNVFLVTGKYEETGFYSFEYPPQEIQDKFKIKRFDPLAYRLMMMEHHYTQQMDFTWEKLAQSQARLFNLRKEGAKLQSFRDGVSTYKWDKQPYGSTRSNLYLHLNNDLKISEFLEMFKVEILKAIEKAKKETSINDEIVELSYIDRDCLNLKLFLTIEKSTIEVINLGKERQKAKEEKNWQLADQLRSEIAKNGYQVDDYSWGYGIWYNPTLKD
jgi:cysteinyl-tRNA synthetase